jgi:hypothetical protein
MCRGNWWNDSDNGKINTQIKQSLCHAADQKPHIVWPGRESGAWQKVATNCLSHGKDKSSNRKVERGGYPKFAKYEIHGNKS